MNKKLIFWERLESHGWSISSATWDKNNILLWVVDFIEEFLIYNSCWPDFHTGHSTTKMLPTVSDYIQKTLNRIGVSIFILISCDIITLSKWSSEDININILFFWKEARI